MDSNNNTLLDYITVDHRLKLVVLFITGRFLDEKDNTCQQLKSIMYSINQSLRVIHVQALNQPISGAKSYAVAIHLYSSKSLNENADNVVECIGSINDRGHYSIRNFRLKRSA